MMFILNLRSRLNPRDRLNLILVFTAGPNLHLRLGLNSRLVNIMPNLTLDMVKTTGLQA